jgi:hypothetical protein
LINTLGTDTPPLGSDSRRNLLISTMHGLQKEGINCFSCTGLCCTSVANSMQITSEEAEDIVAALLASERLDSDLMQKLETTVSRYRLDRPPPGNGVRSFLRRTFTCTFYDEDSGWCQLPPTDKPYGCLAFNPKKQGNVAGESCGSSQTLLDEQALLNWRSKSGIGGDVAANAEQSQLPIPLAVLSVIKRLANAPNIPKIEAITN